MKLAYRTWNKEHYVSDEVIKSDLKGLSKGELTMDEDENIENLAKGSSNNNNNNNNRRRSNIKRSGGGRSRGGRSGGGSSRGGRSNYRRSKR
jgi:uncharacterized membrane protein YgcG